LNERNAGYANPFRRSVDLAHELGHVLFDAEKNVLMVVDENLDLEEASEQDPREQRARAFAAELLMPFGGLVQVLGKPAAVSTMTNARDLIVRARARFRTPHEVTVNHLTNSRFIDGALRAGLVRSPTHVPQEGDGKPGPRLTVLERRVVEAVQSATITRLRGLELLGLTAWDNLPERPAQDVPA